jgi:hypothetical protein
MVQELAQLLIVANGKLEMTGDNSTLLVIARGITSQLENLSGEILKHSSQVDWSTGTDTIFGIVFPKVPMDASYGELQTCFRGARLGFGRVDVACGFTRRLCLSASFSTSFSFCRH